MIFERVLVPVDFAPGNAIALRLAKRLTEAKGQIALVHVIETIDQLPQRELKTFYKKLHVLAERKIARLAAELAAMGARTRVAVLYGKRVDEILKSAARSHAQLIVMGSHRVETGRVGRGWNTISYRVALLAPCPVLLVK